MRFLARPLAVAAVAAAFTFNGTETAAQSFFNKLQNVISGVTAPEGGSSGSAAALPYDDIVAGLRDALRVGSERVVSRLGASDGFNSDPAVHIPLPPELQEVQKIMRKFGLSAMVDEVELKLNRGAEAAMLKAKELIWKAISEMTLEDARKIYDGPDDAATQYFKKVSTADLQTSVRPVIDRTLQDVGAIAAYDALMGDYESLPLVPDVKADLTQHATDLALKGLFHYLAREEAAIRKDPVKRTTEILTRVFGAN